jgi:hypothetical protein
LIVFLGIAKCSSWLPLHTCLVFCLRVHLSYPGRPGLGWCVVMLFLRFLLMVGIFCRIV